MAKSSDVKFFGMSGAKIEYDSTAERGTSNHKAPKIGMKPQAFASEPRNSPGNHVDRKECG
jgi:hypothetical protein